MNAILLINAVSTRLQRTCVKRRSVGWWVWPLVLFVNQRRIDIVLLTYLLSGHTEQP